MHFHTSLPCCMNHFQCFGVADMKNNGFDTGALRKIQNALDCFVFSNDRMAEKIVLTAVAALVLQLFLKRFNNRVIFGMNHCHTTALRKNFKGAQQAVVLYIRKVAYRKAGKQFHRSRTSRTPQFGKPIEVFRGCADVQRVVYVATAGIRSASGSSRPMRTAK